MGYSSQATPPKGEICFWGPCIMKGYFKNPEKTNEAFHNDWLLSGDVGMIEPNGAIRIIDRAKNIFKLSQGEYIAPEKLENVYVQSEWIGQCWMYGDSLRDFVIAFLCIDEDRVKKFAEQNGKEFNDALMNDQTLRQVVYDDLMKLAAINKFNSLEKPKQITLLKEPFSQDELLTPTMKLKRNVAKVYFKDQIDKMYNGAVMSATPPQKKE